MNRPDGDYVMVNSYMEFGRLLAHIMDTGHFAIDVETTSINQMTCKLVGVSLSPKPNEGYYIPLFHEDLEGVGQLNWDYVQPYLAMLCADPGLPKIFFNAIYDMVVLERYGCPVVGPVYDTMITEHTHDNGRYFRFNMSEIARRVLGYDMIPIADLIGKGKKQVTFDKVPISRATIYAAADVDIPMRLFWQRKVTDKMLLAKNACIDFPLLRTLTTVMLTGIMVDLEYMREMKASLEIDIVAHQQRFEEMAGREFSVFAYAALSKLLFDEMKIAPASGFGRSKSGNFSTSADHLFRIRHQHDIIDEIVLLREMNHVLNHHLNIIVTEAIARRIHTAINAVTSTTRLSSSAPNLQNVIVRSVAGYELRKGFIVPPGFKWVKIDYSQIELRVLAHMLVKLFGDWRYAQIFIDGVDVHRATAASIFGIDPERVSRLQRGMAKPLNFGIIYGKGPGGLMFDLECSYAEALSFYNAYLETYPGIDRWMQWQKASGDDNGYVETPFYRTRRYIPKHHHTVCLNTPIQGGAAEIIRKAMNEVQDFIARSGCKSRMLLQVHDELDFEVAEDECAWFIRNVVHIMANTIEMAVPLEVEVEVGDNWGDLTVIDAPYEVIE